jgi:hypothetical protein
LDAADPSHGVAVDQRLDLLCEEADVGVLGERRVAGQQPAELSGVVDASDRPSDHQRDAGPAADSRRDVLPLVGRDSREYQGVVAGFDVR